MLKNKTSNRRHLFQDLQMIKIRFLDQVVIKPILESQLLAANLPSNHKYKEITMEKMTIQALDFINMTYHLNHQTKRQKYSNTK